MCLAVGARCVLCCGFAYSTMCSVCGPFPAPALLYICVSMPKTMAFRYKQERVALLEKMMAALEICRGHSNALTVAAKKELEAAKTMKL